MEIYGIIGKKLDHSFSPEYFQEKFRKFNLLAEYKKFELGSVEELHVLVQSQNELIGLNVTIPFKERVLPQLDFLSPEAEVIGAVNTIKIIRDAGKIKMHGFNTDVIGFNDSLKPLISGRQNLKALILGTGGSAKSVAFVLQNLGIHYQLVSCEPKEKELSYASLDNNILADHLLIINTTPLGMFPNVDSAPDIPYHFLTGHHFLFDLIYNPSETLFLKEGKKKNAIVQNGLNMLHIQAEESWKIWQEEK